MGQKHKNEREKTDWGVLYFSGTGNTKYCVTLLSSRLGIPETPCPLEKEEAAEMLRSHDALIFAYPIQYSNLPDIVRVFIEKNRECWKEKQVFLMATMGLFSGDGTGVAARLLKKYGAVVTGGVHIRMPDSVADVKTLIKPEEENRQIVAAAGEKVRRTAERIKQGKMPRQGLGVFSHLIGLFGQRLYFFNAAEKYKNALKIDTKKCTGCGQCAACCPRENLIMREKVPHQKGNCTMCYRCISGCPAQAITLIGKEVVEQIRIEKFL